MLSLHKTGHNGFSWLMEQISIHASADRVPTMPIDMALQRNLPLSEGQVLALLEGSRGDINAFDAGWGRDSTEVMPTLGRWISQFVLQSPYHLCLMDEQNAEPSESGWLRETSKEFADAVLFCGGSIFYRISQANCSEAYICSLLGLLYSHFFRCVLVTCVAGNINASPPGSEVSVYDLDTAIRGLKGVAIDAYDVEGLVIWTNKENPEIQMPW